MSRKSDMLKISLILNIIVSIIVSYVLTFILHGYVHTVVSYVYGLNSEPWMLYYTSYWLQNITENMEFAYLDQQANFFVIGIISYAALIVYWLLLSIAKFKLSSPKTNVFYLSFWYWLFIWNLAAVFSYIPHHILRVTNITASFHQLGVSIWAAYVISTIVAVYMIFILAYSISWKMLDNIGVKQLIWRWIYLIVSIVIVVFYNNIHYALVIGVAPVIVNGFILIKIAIFILSCYIAKLSR